MWQAFGIMVRSWTMNENTCSRQCVWQCLLNCFLLLLTRLCSCRDTGHAYFILHHFVYKFSVHLGPSQLFNRATACNYTQNAFRNSSTKLQQPCMRKIHDEAADLWQSELQKSPVRTINNRRNVWYPQIFSVQAWTGEITPQNLTKDGDRNILSYLLALLLQYNIVHSYGSNIKDVLLSLNVKQ